MPLTEFKKFLLLLARVCAEFIDYASAYSINDRVSENITTFGHLSDSIWMNVVQNDTTENSTELVLNLLSTMKTISPQRFRLAATFASFHQVNKPESDAFVMTTVRPCLPAKNTVYPTQDDCIYHAQVIETKVRLKRSLIRNIFMANLNRHFSLSHKKIRTFFFISVTHQVYVLLF